MKAKLDTSLWYQNNKLLKVREGASTDEIYITSKKAWYWACTLT